MPKGVNPVPQPVEIPFFSTGFYTYRSQLFSPFKALGVNIIAYHDAVIDGADMELTDLMEWQQRPGYTKFCTEALADNEVINAFYSERALNGVLLTMFDSNQRLAMFDATTITTLYDKTVTAQGFVNQVGDTTYFYDGTDAVRYDQTYGLGPNGIASLPGSINISNTGGWLPNTNYPAEYVLLDYNGNVQYSGTTTGASGTNLPVWSALPGSVTNDGTALVWQNLGTIGSWLPGVAYTIPSVILDTNNNLQMLTTVNAAPLWNSGDVYNIGDLVNYFGLFFTPLVNGLTGSPPDTGLYKTTGTNPVFYTYNWTTAGNPGVSGGTVPIWDTTIGGTTPDYGLTWTNIGPGLATVSSGYSWGASIRTMDGHLSTLGETSVNTGPLLGASAITPSEITAFSITSDVVTIYTDQVVSAGGIVFVTGLTTGTYLNNQALTVATVNPAVSFTAAFTHGDVTLTSDTGTFTPVIAKVTGTGVTDSRTHGSFTITSVAIAGNTVTLLGGNNMFPGNSILISGLTDATFLNGEILVMETCTPTQVTAFFQHADYTPTLDSGTATFAAIEVYRTADGGGLWYYVDALVNPDGGNTWTFYDDNPDNNLDEQVVAPVAHSNDPPPGQAGSIAAPFAGGSVCAYWQGRQWLAQGNYLYFDAGADCQNGDPHQSWPPANRFEYSSTVTKLIPLDQGLLVIMADKIGAVLGGPQTLSFYPYTIMTNFGASSPNAVWQDGQTVYLISTQGQVWAMTATNKTLEGHYVSDYINANFPPASSYITLHRNGLDTGMFLSNATTTILRDGTNVNAWSVPAYPVGGAGALASVETSVGIYSLLLAPPAPPPVFVDPPNYILARNLNSWADEGGPYTNPTIPNQVYLTIGSITLSQPGQLLLPVQHIVGYFDAAGVGGVDQPTVSVLFNNISGAQAAAFSTIPPEQVVNEPPYGATPSTSLQSLRFPCNMINTTNSQYCHHLQVRIQYPNSNAPHTIKALAIKFDQD